MDRFTKHNIIITMAGLSSRFKIAGFTLPKYEINIKNKTLFEWSLLSLSNFQNSIFHFVYLQGNSPLEFIKSKANLLNIKNFKTIELKTVTDGQATTANMCKGFIDQPDFPTLIYNIDTYVEPTYLSPENIKGDGWIPCFKGEGDKWSFARVDSTFKVLEVREKKRISPYATVGLYWFRSFNLYQDLYNEYYFLKDRFENSEKYIAPLYNLFPARNLQAYIDNLPTFSVHPLGTPEDVKIFSNE